MNKYKNRKEIRCPVTDELFTLFDEPIFYGAGVSTKRDKKELNRQIKELQSIYGGLQQGAYIDDIDGAPEYLLKLQNSVRIALDLGSSLPKQIERISDGEIFSLNDDGTTYSLDSMKKKWPEHFHNKYTYERLMSEPLYFRVKK
jgi:hypothetical protein